MSFCFKPLRYISCKSPWCDAVWKSLKPELGNQNHLTVWWKTKRKILLAGISSSVVWIESKRFIKTEEGRVWTCSRENRVTNENWTCSMHTLFKSPLLLLYFRECKNSGVTKNPSNPMLSSRFWRALGILGNHLVVRPPFTVSGRSRCTGSLRQCPP